MEKLIFGICIYNANNDLSKRWFVRVKVPNYKTGTFTWRKCYGNINKFNTVELRQQEAEKLFQQIKKSKDYKKAQGSRSLNYPLPDLANFIIDVFKKILFERSYKIRSSTFRSYFGFIKNLEQWLKNNDRLKLPVGMFTSEDAKSFMRYLIMDKKMSASTYNSHIIFCRSVFKELLDSDIIESNPFTNIKVMKKNSVPALYFQKEQLSILKEEIMRVDIQLWFFVQFIYYCFIRPGELRFLKIENILFDEMKIRIPRTISKNGKEQYVTIPKKLYSQISHWKDYESSFYLFGPGGVPGPKNYSANIMKTRHRLILRRLGFGERHKLYSWKHSGAIAATKAGISLKDLQLQLRHHSLDQVDAYLRDMLVFESDALKNSFPEI